MSVPVSRRKASKLEVLIKALELACYTLEITTNEKIFNPRYKVITDKIVSNALDIYLKARSANDIVVTTVIDFEERRRLQTEAIAHCAELSGLISLAYRRFHLSSKRVLYWNNFLNEVTNKLRAWRNSDKARYSKIL